MSNQKDIAKTSLKEDLIFLLLKIGILLSIGIFTFLFIFGVIRCPDDMMSPSFKNGDLVIYYRLQDNFQSGDTVVVDIDGELQIRRIVAISKDTVDIGDEGLKINGYFQQEQNIYTETLPYKEGIKFPITVGEEEYFVLGDNRPNAKDSRIYGTVKKEDIKGLVMTVIRRRGF